MHLPIGQVKQVLADFLTQEVLPKAAGGAGLVIGVASGMALRKVDPMIEANLPMLKSLGIVDEQNRVDLEVLHEEIGKTLAQTGRVNLMGYLFDQADADALLSIAKKYST